MTAITITFDLHDTPVDGRAPMTWADFRGMVDRNLPAAFGLQVAEGLSTPIRQSYAWGDLKVDVTKATAAERGRADYERGATVADRLVADAIAGGFVMIAGQPGYEALLDSPFALAEQDDSDGFQDGFTDRLYDIFMGYRPAAFAAEAASLRAEVGRLRAEVALLRSGGSLAPAATA